LICIKLMGRQGPQAAALIQVSERAGLSSHKCGETGTRSMCRSIHLTAKLLGATLLAAAAFQGAAAAERSPQLFSRCLQMHALWTKYETANCPNQTGQRAQAEWALSRCQRGDFDRGLPELERLLRRDLIALPPTTPLPRP
jgi:hypothetical protein